MRCACYAVCPSWAALPLLLHQHLASMGSSASSSGAPPSRGAFILFEGVDRCGKSTQSARLVDGLNAAGVAAELWRFPDRTTEVGQMINAYLASQKEIDDAAVHLLFSANRWEKQEALLRALAAGTTLVVDRYAYSGAAFTAAKAKPGLDLAWCKAPDAGLPAPDLVLYLELSVEDALARGGFGEERYEEEQFQREVQKQFGALRDERWRVVDARQSVDAIESEVRRHAEEAIKVCAAGAPIQTLWPAEPRVPETRNNDAAGKR